jgi:hypothetical protein
MYDATYIASASYVLGTPPPLPESAMLYRAVRGDTKSRRPYQTEIYGDLWRRTTSLPCFTITSSPIQSTSSIRTRACTTQSPPQNPAPDNCHTSCRFPDLFVDSEQDVLSRMAYLWCTPDGIRFDGGKVDCTYNTTFVYMLL